MDYIYRKQFESALIPNAVSVATPDVMNVNSGILVLVLRLSCYRPLSDVRNDTTHFQNIIILKHIQILCFF